MPKHATRGNNNQAPSPYLGHVKGAGKHVRPIRLDALQRQKRITHLRPGVGVALGKLLPKPGDHLAGVPLERVALLHDHAARKFAGLGLQAHEQHAIQAEEGGVGLGLEEHAPQGAGGKVAGEQQA
jgi:hypothetical protein